MTLFATTLPLPQQNVTTSVSFFQIFGSACLLALLAQIQIPLPFSPIPLTGQTLGVLLIAARLGSRQGALSVLTYLAMGCFGLPVLAGGSCGALSLVGPRAGYLIGFVVQAYVAGWILERRTHFNSFITFAALTASCALQLTLGSLWLGQFVGLQQMVWLGFVPFIPGEILKAVMVTTFLKSR